METIIREVNPAVSVLSSPLALAWW
jgi:hypothetical protein